MQQPRLNHFHTYDEITQWLQAAQREKPEFCTLETLAQTKQGRAIWCMTLAVGDHKLKPALYVQGGVHAEEGMGITGCLNFIYTVLQEPEILEQVTIYVLPCVNPDGSDLCVRTGLELRSMLEHKENVPNGVVPQDMDGDGKILFMRWEDENGEWKDGAACGAIMVPRLPEDKEGPFYSMYTEGILENYDGGTPQPAMRNLDFNRQYGYGWIDTPNGGDYPGRHVEPRTVMEFLVSHTNVFAAFDLHCGTRALIYGTPENASDSELLHRVAQICYNMTGIPPIKGSDYGRSTGSPAVKLPGHFETFCYEGPGILAATIELGNGYNSIGMEAQEIFDGDLYGEELISRIVAMHSAKGRKISEPWKSFHHPQIGDVEIGGQICGNAYFMDPDDMLELLPKVAEYLIVMSQCRPKLQWEEVMWKRLDDGSIHITAQIANTGALGTKVMRGSAGYQANRDPVQLRVIGAQSHICRPAVHELVSLDAGERSCVEWVLNAEVGTKLVLEARHPKAGQTEISLDIHS